MIAEIAIFGLGNPLMADEGIGIRVLEALRRRTDLPGNVELIDLGTGGWRVLHEAGGRRRLIFVDCARMGEPPGTIRRFLPDDVRSRKTRLRGSLHDGDLLSILEIATEFADCTGEIVLFGIEPVEIKPRDRLSPVLAGRVDEYVEQVLGEARRSEIRG